MYISSFIHGTGRVSGRRGEVHGRVAGDMPEGSERIVSLHDKDARPIKKGRLAKPVEFGRKAQVADNF